MDSELCYAREQHSFWGGQLLSFLSTSLQFILSVAEGHCQGKEHSLGFSFRVMFSQSTQSKGGTKAFRVISGARCARPTCYTTGASIQLRCPSVGYLCHTIKAQVPSTHWLCNILVPVGKKTGLY